MEQSVETCVWGQTAEKTEVLMKGRGHHRVLGLPGPQFEAVVPNDSKGGIILPLTVRD